MNGMNNCKHFFSIDHDFLATPKALLMNAIGHSCCVNTAPILSPEASHLMLKDSLKFGVARVGVVVIAFFRFSNAFSASSVHWNCPSRD